MLPRPGARGSPTDTPCTTQGTGAALKLVTPPRLGHMWWARHGGFGHDLSQAWPDWLSTRSCSGKRILPPTPMLFLPSGESPGGAQGASVFVPKAWQEATAPGPAPWQSKRASRWHGRSQGSGLASCQGARMPWGSSRGITPCSRHRAAGNGPCLRPVSTAPGPELASPILCPEQQQTD